MRCENLQTRRGLVAVWRGQEVAMAETTTTRCIGGQGGKSS
jgi:hypothetical protein